VRVARESERTRDLGARAARCLTVFVERRRDRYDALANRLSVAMRGNMQARRQLIDRSRERINQLMGRAERAIYTLLDRSGARLDRAADLLSAFSYQGVLARGFALVRDAAGVPLRKAAGVASGSALDIEFVDGRVAAVATSGGASKPVAVTPRRRRRPVRNEGQGDLF
jgi:exodeoxyribonuclease VII large subunit